ncbi:MAG: hypothetical protein KOO66_10520 [Bacteroidales bacterium]|nr:hypothetical protein [Bacteroidales bacterium]
MKRFFTLLFLLLIIQESFAQKERIEVDNNEETVFTKDNFKFTGSYIALEFKMSEVRDDIGIFAGGKMGFSFNNKFSLGIAAYGLIYNSDFTVLAPDMWSDLTLQLASIKFIYGGLLLEYNFFSNKIVHFNIPVVIGVGKVSLKGEDDIFLERIEKSSAFVIEPGVELEFNLFKFLKVDVGASYRNVSNTRLQYIDDEDLEGLSYNLTFRFGLF